MSGDSDELRSRKVDHKPEVVREFQKQHGWKFESSYYWVKRGEGCDDGEHVRVSDIIQAFLDLHARAERYRWQDISTAPKCVPSGTLHAGDNGRRPVVVTRHPIKGPGWPPVAIARLTSDGWISGKSNNKLWFQPTHWHPLPEPPHSEEEG